MVIPDAVRNSRGCASIRSVQDGVLFDARRIVVWGCTGSGKTTAARAIGQLTGLPVVDGDALCWRPGWEGVPREEQVTAFAEIARRSE